MKKRTDPVTYTVTLLCSLIFSAQLFTGSAENTPHNTPDSVKILILSKHIRLLKEGKTVKLSLSLPGRSEIDSDGKRIPGNALEITNKNGSVEFSSGNSILEKHDFTVFPGKQGDTFSIILNGEKRLYPLPLHVKYNGTDTELSIEENVNRFAIDSACSELGDLPEKTSEALYALAHLIKARCAIPSLTHKHKGYTFCDLSCCQSYKGISGRTFDDPISIKTAGNKNGFFFNTSSGGNIFTESIFNGSERTDIPPKDVIYSENMKLSDEKYRSWTASIGETELSGIIYPGKKLLLKNIFFDREKEVLTVESDNGGERFAPESFRIRVNRVKGWSFIKSNNYTLTQSDGFYKFTGSGLGHGAGLSFEGAIQLASRGYSRYEIIEHYYPSVEYTGPGPAVPGRILQYILFNSESGEIIHSSTGISFTNRIVPCGSLFKLFAALYLAEKRPDLFHNYSYTCTGHEKDKLIPEYCWKKPGHGKMSLTGALSNSCNKYFASLYDKIDPEDFRKWTNAFTKQNGIDLTLPPSGDRSGFAGLLAGLNFRTTISVAGIIKLNRFLYTENRDHKTEASAIIMDALHKTFTEGTASETDAVTTVHNTLPGYNTEKKDLWGKTGTVIAGTNSHCSYGIFTGGKGPVGIVAILRKGTGALAANESGKILSGIK